MLYTKEIKMLCFVGSNSVSKRLVNTSPIIYLNQKWRQERGLPKNPNASGILTDSPDFSFLDGRSTPYGARQKVRMQKHRQITEQIIKLTAEVDFAVERHQQLQLEEENRQKKMLENKLKPKGVLLLKNNK